MCNVIGRYIMCNVIERYIICNVIERYIMCHVIERYILTCLCLFILTCRLIGSLIGI